MLSHHAPPCENQATHSVICDQVAMSPRYNCGDILYLRHFHTYKSIGNIPDVWITTTDGRVFIGRLTYQDSHIVKILQLYRQQCLTIPAERQPILYEIIASKPANTPNIRPRDRYSRLKYDINNA